MIIDSGVLINEEEKQIKKPDMSGWDSSKCRIQKIEKGDE